ncbi:hypothetical protein AB733_09550 [Photobacterium swingsii]|uniref:Lipoprotein n=1 Tax=Photobacterium swingsii TaxID=680026 RepID=A0A0J8VBZ8_9GAMM|nr:hypothetical protein [Photobacterium swingsii]KMV30831.1 hypothetical protein AB733_09550 [Photobacterium swingsii]PSW25839.1 hypothetical protein C9I94_04515 [Photobacterium swingsii]
MFRTALLTALPIVLLGCGGSGDGDSGIDAVSNAVDGIARTRQADLHFINSTNEAVDYHIRNTLSEGDLFASTNKATENMDKDVTPYMYRWNVSDNVTIQLGIQDTNTKSIQAEIENMLIRENADLWVVAWLDDAKSKLFKLSTLKRSRSDVAGEYRVRVFSQKDAQIITTSSVSINEAKQGVVTPYITVENCSGDLYFGPESIDICQLEIGKSYLLITDGEELLMAAEE